MFDPDRRSPVMAMTDSPTIGGRSVSVRELAFLGHLQLRFKGGGASPDLSTMAPLEAMLGQALPRRGDVFAAGPVTTMRLSSRRWLFITDPDANPNWMATLGPHVPADAVLFDLTEAFDTLAIEGAHARDLLAAGCPLDLHDRSFPIGAAASTRLAQASIVLRRTGASQYRVHVDVSDVGYLWAWLKASADEFECKEE